MISFVVDEFMLKKRNDYRYCLWFDCSSHTDSKSLDFRQVEPLLYLFSSQPEKLPVMVLSL